MFTLSAYYLARIQFALTIGFHIIFPASSMGIAMYLAALEAAFLWTGRQVYLDVYQFWIKIFALVFGIGVVTGIVMGYELGLNWSVYAYKVGPILGPLLTYETLTAFFLEAGFLGIMLFGMKGRQRTAFRRDLRGGLRHASQRVLDSRQQLLDANAARL